MTRSAANSETASPKSPATSDRMLLESLIDETRVRRGRRRMPAARRLSYVNFATLLTCLLFLYDGHEPGWSVFTCVSLLMFNALAVAWAVASFQWLTDDGRPRGCMWGGVLRMAVTPLLVVACGAMVICSIPARIGLWASLDDFRPLLKQAPQVTGGKELHRRVGWYDVIRYAADGKGGVYFVTGDYRDSLKNDHVSLGFAFNPSKTGTPFGKDQYRLTHVCGRWYSFAATEPGN
jgi:hypothetical protein